MDVFGEIELRQHLDGVRATLQAAVNAESAEYLLNVDEGQYAQHILGRFQIEPLGIHFDAVTVSSREEQIPASRFPRFDFYVVDGKSYPRQVIRYHIPFEGDHQLLRCVPNPRIAWTHEVEIEDGHICFDVIDFYNDAGKVRAAAERVLGPMRQQFEHVTKNVSDFDDQLPNLVKKLISERKEQLKKRIDVASSLGVPIRKTANVPETFRIPEVRRKVTARPAAPKSGGRPEPTLGDDIYEEILRVIHDTGKVFERLPSTYAGKDEEALRDHFILQLEPRFEGSTTGETFNKSGKTDILIRHEKANVFVAECQWWDGPKKHQDKIDQLLGYLTWRDSKTALITFVGRKDVTAVLKQIRVSTENHGAHEALRSSKDESWLNYEFHLPGDPERKLRLAVMAFHLPRDRGAS